MIRWVNREQEQDYIKRINISENVFTNRIYFIKGKVGIDYLTEISLDY